MRAAFMSMWLEKVDGKAYTAYSLAGLGTQCVGRDFYADYFDVERPHPQIKNYIHPLDSFAWMDYQHGVQCMYGTEDLTTNLYLQSEFGKLVGQSGPSIFLDKRYSGIARLTRYYSHSLDYMMKLMKDPAVL